MPEKRGELTNVINYHYYLDKCSPSILFKTEINDCQTLHELDSIVSTLKEMISVNDDYTWIKIKLFRNEKCDSLYMFYGTGGYCYFNGEKRVFSIKLYELIYKILKNKADNGDIQYIKNDYNNKKLIECLRNIDPHYLDFLKEQLSNTFELTDSILHQGYTYTIYNYPILREDRQTIINKIAEFLKLKSNLFIEIQVHSDDLKSFAEALFYTDSLANNYKNAFIELGIQSDRIVAKGYGQTQPDVACVDYTDNIHKYDTLSVKYIKNLPEIDQPKARYLNKRFVVKIIKIKDK